MTPAQRWGAALAREMAAQKLRAADVAKITGVPAPTIANWLKGNSLPTPASAHRVADDLLAPALAALCDRLRPGTCADCGRAFLDASRRAIKTHCSTRCWNRQRWRRVRAQREADKPAKEAVTHKRLALYMDVANRMCRQWCAPGGLCPDATCPIQAAGLSPLPLAHDALRIA